VALNILYKRANKKTCGDEDERKATVVEQITALEAKLICSHMTIFAIFPQGQPFW
jgi:NifU-like protein involved in Fe-S cluster formation